MIFAFVDGWTNEMRLLAGFIAIVIMLFLISVATRKRAIIGLFVILGVALGFRVYLMYGNVALESKLRPSFLYFHIGVLSIIGVILVLAIWPIIKKKFSKHAPRVCKDWAKEKNYIERFRKRLAFETYAVSLENIKVWRRRNIFVTITAPKYPGEYLIPADTEGALDTMSLDELVNYRYLYLIDDVPCPTHIEALDNLLDGGTYRGQLNLIQGPIRSGRSLSATLIASSVINNGGNVLFITAHSERHTLIKGISPLLNDPSPGVLNQRFKTARFAIDQPVGEMFANVDRLLAGITYDFVFVDNIEALQNKKGDIPDRLMHGKVWAIAVSLLRWAKERGLPLWIAVQGDFASGELLKVADNSFLTSFKEQDDGNVRITLRPLLLHRPPAVPQDISLTLVKS